MRINDYLNKLRSKPERERRKIAVAATGVAFAVIFLIWIASFSEMNREAEKINEEESAASADGQLEDASGDVGDGVQSIEEMIQGLAEEDLGAEEEAAEGAFSDQGPKETSSEEETENNSQDINGDQGNQPEIPQLP